MIKRLAALAMTLALFICAAATAHAAQSEYGDIDRLYSRDGNESIYISESKYLYNFKGDYPGVTVCGYAGDSKDLKIPLIIMQDMLHDIDLLGQVQIIHNMLILN